MNGFENRRVAQINRDLETDLQTPTDTRMSDGSCERLLGLEADQKGVCLVTSSRPRLLFIGDSYSMAMFSAIKKNVVDVPAVLLALHSHLWARPDCLRSQDFGSWLRGNEACQHLVRDAFKLIAGLDSIEAVVFVPSNGNPYFRNSRKVGALQEYALQHGKQVIYVLSNPSFRPPSSCAQRTLEVFGRPMRVARQADACRAPRNEMEISANRQRLFIASIMAGDKRVHLYDPTSVFCDARYCDQSDDKGVLFWLGGHVNVRGSQKMLDDFLPWSRRELHQQ